MESKKGAATLYIIVGLTIFLGIMTYVFSQTSNLEVDILTYFGNIKKEYEKNISQEEKNNILSQLQNDINELEIIVTEENE